MWACERGLVSPRIQSENTRAAAGTDRDVATLVVRVDGEVETHELDELGVVAVAELGRQVLRVVGVGVDGDGLLTAVDVAEDAAGNHGQLGDEVHRVVEGGLPVLLLVNAVLVSLGEGRVVVELEVGRRGGREARVSESRQANERSGEGVRR